MSGAYQPTDFFETAAMLITLVLMGKYLESAVSGGSGGCLGALTPTGGALAANRLPSSPLHPTAEPRHCCCCLVRVVWHHTVIHPAVPPPQAKGKTSEAITKLCQLAPPTALLLVLDGEGAVVGEQEVETDMVHRGDLLKVG